jgi:signal transduction histidine kinase
MSRDALRVLLVEDSEDDADLILVELKRGGYEPSYERVFTANALRSALDHGPWDLVIADYRMPLFSGLEALKIVKERGPDLPFILVSGAVGEDEAVLAMKAGAHDYVMKDKLARLAPAVRREIEEAGVRRKRREAETKLQEAYAVLERRVEERTAELSQANARLREELRERERLQDERNRMFVRLIRGQKLQAIGQLAAGVAHEINNPVGWILSNVGTLEKYIQALERLLRDTGAAVKASAGPASSRLREEFARLWDEAEAEFLLRDFRAALRDSKDGAIRIRDIVASLRAFSHPDERAPEDCDVGELLESAIRLCAGELKYKAKVVRDIGRLPRVRCRAQQIEQVFINLLVNAAQAIPERGEVAVSAAREGRDAVVRIRDTGTGIPPEHLKRLFEPFFTTKPVGKGTGLGLHVAYKIVRAHGGRIEIATKAGEGTEVTVRLPLGREAEEDEGSEAPGLEKVPSGKPLVVLVDDDAASLRVLRRILAAEPVRLLSTRDPRKALEWVRSRDVRIILADQRMPEMKGTDLLGEVARRSPTTRRLLITAYPESAEVKDSPEGIVEQVIAKPWDDDGLRRAVRLGLGRSAL